jgi:D-alanyl-lipoteichoic acid acyltransferase DltB (MBOAT superfamily)
LRDYLYIPLGGNRKGPARTYLNLMITMLIGGLWHGANWTFVVWGGLHGTYLCAERFIREQKTRRAMRTMTVIRPDVETAQVDAKIVQQASPSDLRGILYALFIFGCIVITWVFFRAATFAQAGGMLSSMFGATHNAHPLLTTLAMVKAGVVVLGLLGTQWLLRNTSLTAIAYRTPWWLTGLAWSCMMILIFLGQESTGSFIYFQF